MASWKLCALLLLAVFFVLAYEAHCERGRPRRQQGRQNAAVTQGGGRRRGGGRGVGGGAGRGAGRGASRGRGAGSPGERRADRRRGNRRRGGQVNPIQRAALARTLTTSTVRFSTHAYGQMAMKNADNFLFSPICVYTAMSMVSLAANGRTKREVLRGMNIPSRFNPHLALKLYNAGNDNNDLHIANALYRRANLTLRRGFERKLSKFYNSETKSLAETNPEDYINTWVEENTGGEVVGFLPEGTITSDTLLYLVNAVYFKKNWKKRFDTASSSFERFVVSDTESHQVLMMSREGLYRVHFSEDLGATLLELPYEGDRFAFYVILPQADTPLSTVESRYADSVGSVLETALTSMASLNPQMKSVVIPKMALDTEQAFKEILQSLRIEKVFTRAATLRKMLQAGISAYVSEVEHRAVLELDEEGTTGAAATGVPMQTLSASLPEPFRADRPFLFVLRDKTKKVNLFMGRYVNPMGDNLKV